LPRILGFQRAKEILFFGEELDAHKLLELGLVNKILPHNELIDYSKKMALKLVPPKGASLAVGLTKRALHRPLIEAVSRALDVENEGLNKAFASVDFWEALAARKEKREPDFKGA
jgi:enoyl-CoA hydratase/carnithine racemase